MHPLRWRKHDQRILLTFYKHLLLVEVVGDSGEAIDGLDLSVSQGAW